MASMMKRKAWKCDAMAGKIFCDFYHISQEIILRVEEYQKWAADASETK